MTNLATTLNALFTRDLRRLSQEIDAYTDETMLWQIAPGISNSAGNLCLHLLGNLNTYIGNELGKTGYVRDREREFSSKNVPKSILLAGIEAVTRVINEALSSLTDTQLSEPYPVEVLGYPMTIHYFLTHLSGHLNYHLGQIDYHRRLLTDGWRVTFVNQ